MKVLQILAAVGLALCGLPAKADLFNFTYTFHDGSFVSGSLVGDANGQFVDNVSNVSMSLNGNSFAGSPNLYSLSYDASHGWQNTNPAKVSFDGSLNNFLFIDSDYPVNATYTNYFQFVSFQGIAEAYSSPLGADVFDSGGNPIDPSRWSLANVTTPIPEPETYAMLLAGLGLLGFAARRRKLKEAAAA